MGNRLTKKKNIQQIINNHQNIDSNSNYNNYPSKNDDHKKHENNMNKQKMIRLIKNQRKEIDSLCDIIKTFQIENKKLEKNINILKIINISIRHKQKIKTATHTIYQDFIDNMNKNKIIKKDEMIKFINEFMKNNKNVNNEHISKFIEKYIYENVFAILLDVIDDFVDNINAKFTDHTFLSDITSINEDLYSDNDIS